MFDVGFSELVVLGVIALIVLGPERLPVVARQVGTWAGRARSYMRSLTQELERDVNTADLRRTMESARSQFEHGRSQFESEMRSYGDKNWLLGDDEDSDSKKHRPGDDDVAGDDHPPHDTAEDSDADRPREHHGDDPHRRSDDDGNRRLHDDS
ncbi:MAG: Sec-independent protein translocase protein TatB [Salinisphaera sp.]|nr:Sec-independent protein translocase protein TatB [Nevskiaceae bacterium]MDN5937963.1 Sec-independent protein translocase protein TatB [Salinisphaera sp.]